MENNMTFQTTVQNDQSTGIPGEYAESGPHRQFPGIIKSANAAANIFSRAFSHVAAQDDNVIAGGTGVFAGLLMNPKEHASLGGSSPLDATLTLPSEIDANFADNGIVYATISTTADIGDDVHYVTLVDGTAGTLIAVAPGTTPAANNALIPGAKIVRRNLTTTGQVGVIQLNA